MRLSGKVAAITGAASGQGAAAARRFSEEGASIALLDWNGDQGGAMERELVDAGRSAVFHRATGGRLSGSTSTAPRT